MRQRGIVSLSKAGLELISSAKSFEHNPLIGSRALNERGLHVARVRMAHRVAAARRARSGRRMSAEDRAAFERDGFLVQRDFLPAPVFAALVEQLTSYRGAVREKLEGDTLMRKLTVDEAVRRKVPALDHVVNSPLWNTWITHAGACDMEPAIYIQSLFRSAKPGAVDPQTLIHADTFHPNAKAWLFLTDVAEDEGAFTYVPGSHRLTSERLEWEARMSVEAASSANREAREGSFRASPEDLARMRLPAPMRLAVPANTLVVADTFGFHARGPSVRPSKRIEVWGFGRRSPFVPWGANRAILRLAQSEPATQDEWLRRDGVSPFDGP